MVPSSASHELSEDLGKNNGVGSNGRSTADAEAFLKPSLEGLPDELTVKGNQETATAQSVEWPEIVSEDRVPGPVVESGRPDMPEPPSKMSGTDQTSPSDSDPEGTTQDREEQDEPPDDRPVTSADAAGNPASLMLSLSAEVAARVESQRQLTTAIHRKLDEIAQRANPSPDLSRRPR
jgi:hypothetical protein